MVVAGGKIALPFDVESSATTLNTPYALRDVYNLIGSYMRNLIDIIRNRNKIRDDRKSAISFKRYLISLNQDIDKLSGKSHTWDDSKFLNDIEFYTLILEDRRFYYHNGFDSSSIARELLKLVTLKRFGGASTIEMQFVRTITENYERTISRKIYEIILSYLLQFQTSKVVILRSYLDIAYFGTGLKGVEAVAEAIWQKPPSQIYGYEAAVIASILISPCPRSQTPEWAARVERRARYALAVGSRLEKRFQEIGVR